LGLGDRVPPSRGLQANHCRAADAKTVWLYREALAKAGKMEEVFGLFDGHLARQGYIARGGQILDASIVPVPRNHNTRDENAAIKKGEVPEDWADKPAKRVQKEVDARWTKKHGKTRRSSRTPRSRSNSMPFSEISLKRVPVPAALLRRGIPRHKGGRKLDVIGP